MSQQNSQQIINEINDDDNDDEEFEQMIKDFWNESSGNKNNELSIIISGDKKWECNQYVPSQYH